MLKASLFYDSAASKPKVGFRALSLQSATSFFPSGKGSIDISCCERVFLHACSTRSVAATTLDFSQ